MPNSADKTGRSIRHYANRRAKKRAQPPEGESWVWITREMLESPAWRAMRLAARKVVDRVALEHMAHSGIDNGRLIVTFSNFEAYGIRRKSIADAIDEAEALGFIDVVERGGTSYAEIRRPSRYGLTWLDRADGSARSNRWKVHQSLRDALAAVRRAQARPGNKRPVAKAPLAPGAKVPPKPGAELPPACAKSPTRAGGENAPPIYISLEGARSLPVTPSLEANIRKRGWSPSPPLPELARSRGSTAPDPETQPPNHLTATLHRPEAPADPAAASNGSDPLLSPKEAEELEIEREAQERRRAWTVGEIFEGKATSKCPSLHAYKNHIRRGREAKEAKLAKRTRKYRPAKRRAAA